MQEAENTVSANHFCCDLESSLVRKHIRHSGSLAERDANEMQKIFKPFSKGEDVRKGRDTQCFGKTLKSWYDLLGL